jgi:diguanylate cyclase (GGDEF)-like protein/PAS domain S-box-containing protein
MLVAGFPCLGALPHRSHLPQAVVFKMAMDANAHEKRTAGNALLAEQTRAQITLDSIGDGVISADGEGKVTYLNLAAERMTGWTRDEATSRMFAEVFHIIHCDTREPVPNPMELAVRQNGAVGLPANTVLVRRDGLETAIEDSTAPIHDQGGQIVGSVMVFRDVGKARVMESQLSHLSQHDFLTGLPNRMLLNDRLKNALALARRHRTKVAVLFVDVDRFKQINDSLGHSIGDKVLQVLGRRLEETVRESDTVCRHGGDEFVIVLSEVEHAQNAARHAEKIRVALSPPHTIEQHDLHVNVSIGISVFPDDGQDAETLIEHADAAMYHAKESGRNNYRVFQPGMKRLNGKTANAQDPARGSPERQGSAWNTRRTVSAVQSDTRAVRDEWQRR